MTYSFLKHFFSSIASTTTYFSLSSRPENMNDTAIFSIMASLADWSFGTILALKSSFLLWRPNASAETEALGPFFFYLTRSSGKTST
jgi:hypothetical protein